MTNSQGMKTVIKHPDGNITNGWVQWNTKGPVLTLDNGETVSNEEGYFYRVHDKVIVSPTGASVVVPLTKEVMVELKPSIVVQRPYAEGMAQTDVMIYPPASENWYGRMVKGKELHQYFIHRIDNNNNLWMTVLSGTSSVLESHRIFPYEAETIMLEDDLQAFVRIRELTDRHGQTDRVREMSILNGPSPDWEKLKSILSEIPGIIPIIQDNMEDTLSPLIPKSIDDETHDEILTFLAMLLMEKIPSLDVMEIFDRLTAMPISSFLLTHYLVKSTRNELTPNYVQILNRKLKDTGKQYERSTTSSMLHESLSLDQLEPSVIEVLEKLNKEKKIVKRLPITKEMAMTNPAQKRLRLLLFWSSIKLELIPRLDVINLNELLYLGGALQWPSRFMSWSGLLDDAGRNVRFSSLIMADTSTTQVRRIKSSFMETAYYIRRDNFDLYDFKSSRWKIKTKYIQNSLEEQQQIKSFKREFKLRKKRHTTSITRDEAKVLDFAHSPTLFLHYLESNQLSIMSGLSQTAFYDALDSLQNKGVIDILYSIPNSRFAGILSIFKGQPESVLSATRGLLKYTPLSAARITYDNRISLVTSRLPEYLIPDFIESLRLKNKDSDLTIRCSHIINLRTYRHNLFQRLLKPDGTWFDDISSLTSQIRS